MVACVRAHLHGDAVKPVAHVEATVLGGHRQGMQAKVAHLPPEVDTGGKAIGCIDAGCVRGNHTLRKLLYVLSEGCCVIHCCLRCEAA